MAIHFSDLQTVNGTKLLFTMTRNVDDQVLEGSNRQESEGQFIVKADTFTKPKP